MKKVYILLSGGIDSMACIYFFKSLNYDVKCINVDYGQKARTIEKKAARAVADFFSCPISYIVCSGLPVIDEGEIVGRNALLITVVLFVIQKESAQIATGIHSGTKYVDCNLPFEDKMQAILDIYTDGKVQLMNPFMSWTKEDIWRYCLKYNLPIYLTYSCEQGTVPSCGKCPTCKDLEALKNVSEDTMD